MRVFLMKRVPGRIEFGIIYGGFALLALCAGRFLPILMFAPFCTFKGLTGMPCPACGSTRTVVYLAHGDITASFGMNPLVSLCFLTAVIYFFYSLITLTPGIPRVNVILSDKEKNVLWATVIMLMIVNWTYLIFTL